MLEKIKIWMPLFRKWKWEFKQFSEGHMRKIRMGNENPENHFYYISVINKYTGVFTSVTYVMNEIEYAIKNNMIPVVEVLDVECPGWAKGKQLLNENAWEYFFEQPVGAWGIDDVKKSKNVTTCWKINRTTKQFHNVVDLQDINFLCQDNNLKYWNGVYRKYIKYIPEIADKITYYANILPKDGKVLGVSYRSQFAALYAIGHKIIDKHSKVPSFEEMIDLTKDYFDKWDCQYIFVSADSREGLELFKSAFGDKCLYIDRPLERVLDNGKFTSDFEKKLIEFDREDGNYLLNRNIDYICEVEIMAKCNCFFGTKGSGALFSFLINGGNYEHAEFWDKGKYHL